MMELVALTLTWVLGFMLSLAGVSFIKAPQTEARVVASSQQGSQDPSTNATAATARPVQALRLEHAGTGKAVFVVTADPAGQAHLTLPRDQSPKTAVSQKRFLRIVGPF